MIKNDYILIGSDIPIGLNTIVEKVSSLDGNICITATSIYDCVNILKSLEPKLIIVYFKENQNHINTLIECTSQLKVPIIYLTRIFENKKINILDDTTIFVQSYEDAMKRNVLSRNISSMIKLLKKTNSEPSFPLGESFVANQNNEKNLARYTLELDQKVAMLNKIKQRIEYLAAHVDISTRSELLSLTRSIKLATGDKNHWEDFKIYFENINPSFLKNLANMYPVLTGKDLKYCCYLKMNMSNDDIRHVLGINQESVRTHKYRLKKKMTLSKEQNLRHYLQSLVN